MDVRNGRLSLKSFTAPGRRNEKRPLKSAAFYTKAVDHSGYASFPCLASSADLVERVTSADLITCPKILEEPELIFVSIEMTNVFFGQVQALEGH